MYCSSRPTALLLTTNPASPSAHCTHALSERVNAALYVVYGPTRTNDSLVETYGTEPRSLASVPPSVDDWSNWTASSIESAD
ncbi:putative signal peptide protein [Halorubrum sp. AJ67]|nr:putative signal peptide protein [Halorubrum sp. AJ67]